MGVGKALAPEGTPNPAGIEAKNARPILCDMPTESNADPRPLQPREIQMGF